MNNLKSCKRSLFRACVLTVATSGVSAGCASMKAPTQWFSKSATEGNLNGGGQTSPGLASSLSSAGQGIGGQVKTMGTTMTSAMGKAKAMVIAPFSSTPANGDPTSLSSMPTNLGPEIWVTNGQLYESQGKHAKAMENYAKALEIEPKNEAALLSMARLHSRQQQFSEAEKYFNQLLAMRPQAEVYNELGSLLQKQGRPQEGLAAVEQAISMEPGSQRYRDNLASMLVAGGQSNEAVQQLAQVFPPAVASYKVAYLHFANQDLAGAQAHLQVALQADPNLKEARDLWAKINGSPTAQAGIAAYESANQIYRTAQAAVTPQTPAGAAVYQQSASALPVNTQAAGYPQYPAAQYPAAQYPAAQ